MSMDIRSYFTKLSKPKENVETVPYKPKQNDSGNNSKRKKTKENENQTTKSTKRRRIVQISSDSESESENIFRKKNDNSTKRKNKTTKKEHDLNKEQKNDVVVKEHDIKLNATKEKIILRQPKVVLEKKEKKLVNPMDIFGNEPIVQQHSKHQQEQQASNSNSNKICTEVNIHSDDDFDRTLFELDETELINNSIATEKQSTNESVNTTPQSRKRKLSKTEHSDVDLDQSRYEKKQYSAMLYQKYLNRSGPAHLDSKWIPKGNSDCLKSLSFLITGVLDSLQRDDAQSLITNHGGKCVQSVSKKVNYVVYGEDAGPAKIEKAKQLNITLITEDELIDLICLKSKIKNQNKHTDDNDITSTTSVDEEEQHHNDKKQTPTKDKQQKDQTPTKDKKQKDQTPTKDKKQNRQTPTKEKQQKKQEINEEEIVTKKNRKESTKTDVKKQNDNKIVKIENQEETSARIEKMKNIDETLSLVDKYKPMDVTQIIGQQGERSNMQKLTIWLKNWTKNQNGKTKLTRPSPWAKNDDGSFFKTALLSGPPGIGKTTTATLVAQRLGYDTIEFNASDTRNKRMIHEQVAQIVKTKSIAHFLTDDNNSAACRRHVLLMDEVDGMSGNEDRGGIQELIALIKNTHIPIICMCNDRQHPKIRTLANYCFDLRFSRPRLEQIKGAMMSICFKEHIKIPGDTLTEIIRSTDMDIRQTLNHLSLWSNAAKNPNQKSLLKDVRLGPWEVVRKVFSQEDHKTMTLVDKCKLFFHDYSIGPLFVQENYIKVVPHCNKKVQLERFALAADCISFGDTIDTSIRSTQNWSLLELQGVYSTVLPGYYLEGHFGGQIDFPHWLGKNSKTNKFQRLLTEIYGHVRMSISGSKNAVNLDYLSSFRNGVVCPLLNEGASGISESLKLMSQYSLLRDDLNSIIELSQWPKTKNLFDSVDSKVKAAFTRAYNKECTVLPYSLPNESVKKGKGTVYQSDEDENFNDEIEDDEKDEDINVDAMIKVRKATKANSNGKTTASTSKAQQPKTKTKKMKK